MKSTTSWSRVAGTALVAALAVTAAGCDSATGPNGSQNVSVGFRVPSGAPAPSLTGPNAVAGPPMTIDGTNGSLTLTEILLIVDEVELKHADGSCDDDVPGAPDCEEFEAPPVFLDLPLDGEPIEAVTASIPAGSYKELDFEIEDLEDDEDDPARAAQIEALRTEILALVPNWPRKASVRVSGTFTPTGGAPEDFRVFVDAEIEIELDLVPNLTVGEDGARSRTLTVNVRPDLWFARADGSVIPLSEYDFTSTGDLLEIEVEMEEGFTEIEID